MNMTPTEAALAGRRGTWLRRAGQAGFLFFLIKGLLWLTAPLLAVWLGRSL